MEDNTDKNKPAPQDKNQSKYITWLKKPWVIILVVILVVGIVYLVSGNDNKKVSQAETSQISELQKQLAELRAEKESEEQVKEQAAAAEAKKQQEITALIADAEARAKKNAMAEAKAELEAEAEETKSAETNSDFVGIPADVKRSKTGPEWVSLKEVQTIIDGNPVTVALPLIKTPVGPRPYIGDIQPNMRFDWQPSAWMRLNVAFEDGGVIQTRRGFNNPIRRNSNDELVEELWVLVPTPPRS